MELRYLQYCIVGSIKSGDGFGAISSHGYYPNETIDRMDKWQLGETQVYWLHHNEKYVSYSLRENRILPLGSSRGASFTFNLRIDRNKQLENNVSPYTMLKDMYDSFMGKFMTPTLDGGRFTPKSPEITNSDQVSQFVEEVLGKYKIVNRVGAFPEPMNPEGKTGILKLPKEKLEDFFRDTCYHEFSNFCNIEIGSACETSPELVGVLDNIPRVKTYSVFVRDKYNKEYENSGKILSSTTPDSYCSASLSVSDTKEYPTVRFSLNKLFSAKDNRITESDGSTVELQDGRINCSLVPKEFNYKVFVEVDGASRDVNSFKNSSLAKITVNDEPVNLQLAYSSVRGFEMPASSVIDKKVSVTPPSGIKASVPLAKVDKWKKTLTISFYVEKEQQIENRMSSYERESPTSTQSPFTPVRKSAKEESDELNGRVIELNDKINAQEDEIKSLKSQRIIYGLVGIAAGLILCGAAWLVYSLMSDNIVDARQQVLAYANCNQAQWQALAEKDGLLKLEDLISKLENKDKIAAEIFFNFDKIDSLKNDIDSDNVKQYKSQTKTKFSDWKSFCEASDAIRRMKNPLPNNNIVTLESKKTVLELLSQDTPSNKIDDYKQCDDWNSIGENTQKYLEYLLKNQTSDQLKKISTLDEIYEKAVFVAQEKLRSEINKKIPGYCNKNEHELKVINEKLIKMPECKIANATSVVNTLFPITDPNGEKQREMCSIVGTYKNAKNQTHFNSWSEITKASQKKKKTEK